MAQNEAPKLTKVNGELAYLVHQDDLPRSLKWCVECPSSEKCSQECGEDYYFVREDVWLKTKLQRA